MSTVFGQRTQSDPQLFSMVGPNMLISRYDRDGQKPDEKQKVDKPKPAPANQHLIKVNTQQSFYRDVSLSSKQKSTLELKKRPETQQASKAKHQLYQKKIFLHHAKERIKSLESNLQSNADISRFCNKSSEIPTRNIVTYTVGNKSPFLPAQKSLPMATGGIISVKNLADAEQHRKITSSFEQSQSSLEPTEWKTKTITHIENDQAVSPVCSKDFPKKNLLFCQNKGQSKKVSLQNLRAIKSRLIASRGAQETQPAQNQRVAWNEFLMSAERVSSLNNSRPGVMPDQQRKVNTSMINKRPQMTIKDGRSLQDAPMIKFARTSQNTPSKRTRFDQGTPLMRQDDKSDFLKLPSTTE